MPDTISIQSTSDTPAEVRAALGLPPEEAVTPETTAAEDAPAGETQAEEPPAPAAEATAADAADDADDDEPDDAGDDETKPADPSDEQASSAARTLAGRRTALRRRFDSLTARVSDIKRERDRFKAEAEALRSRLDTPDDPATKVKAPEPKVAEPAPDAAFDKPRPTQDQFEDFEKYLEARDEWTAERGAFLGEQRAMARIEAERQAKAQAEAEAKARQEVAATLQRYQTFKAAHPDYDEVVSDLPQLPESVIGYLVHEDTGPAIAYYLGQHPDEAQRIAALPGFKAVAAIGRIEAALERAPASETSEAPAKPAPKPVPVSKAPAPVTTVGTGSAHAGQKDPDKMTTAEFFAWRDEQERRQQAS
jgi:hypothetical protein